MLAEDHPAIAERYGRLMARIRAQGVERWTEGHDPGPGLDGLVYLCKFAFFTGLTTKAEIGRLLDLDSAERRQLVKGWYDDHRAKGCGTC